MKRAVLIVIALAVVAAVRVAADEPKGPAPGFVYVSGVDKDKGQIMIRDVVTVPVTVPVTREVVVGGQKRTVTENVIQYRSEVREVALDVTTMRVLDNKGNELKGDEVWKRLAAGKVVLRQPSGAVDPAYLKVLADDAVVLTTKDSPSPK